MPDVKIKFTLNGEIVEKSVKPNTTLLDLLRRGFNLTGTKKGCERGECGACTVLLDGEPVNSCLILAPKVNNHSVVTIEGLGKPGKLHPLQQAFIQNHAVQCGFCTPGMILSAKALLDKNPHPTRADVKRAIAGNLCRCTGYTQIIDAVMAASKEVS
ncbi:MAG: (2Fe-2S)-binding protein [Candidatus Bathyarchaeota archaeon]